MASTNMNIRMDADVKREAEDLFSEFGMNMTTAINIFLRQAIFEQKIPFAITRKEIPNEETIAAMEEAKRLAHDPNAKDISNFSEYLEEIRREVESEYEI
jgi:DNA-damage-inducible protein J